MDKIRINLYELLLCLTGAQDLATPQLSNHNQQVAYLSFRLAEKLNLSIEQQKKIFLAALVHDIGAVSSKERLELIEAEPPLNVNNHALKGAKLLEKFKPLKGVTNIIKYHHIPWGNGSGICLNGEEIPYASHIIHLADRVCAMIGTSQNVLSQIPAILSTIEKQKNTVFEPRLVEKLNELSKIEYIWIDLISLFPGKKVPDIGIYDTLVLKVDDIIDLAFVFSQIIDFRSNSTARHSAGVAKTAEKLAQLFGFSPLECKMMLVAGYLHDLGKLAIDDSILEKPAKLNEEEFNEIRAHSYYTYQTLDPIKEFRIINLWASYHHERVDGKGYPFHISGESLPIGSRIMAVADVFTAIAENRSYRLGMEDSQAIEVINEMVEGGALDGNVAKKLIDNFDEINNLREQAQQEAEKRYNDFWQSV